MTTRLQTVEKSYQKNAWILIAGVGVLGTIFGLMLILGVVYDPTYFSNQLGQQVNHFSSTDPKAWSAIQNWERDEGTELFGFSLFAAAIASTAYRRGEKWAWYVFWYLPIYALYGTIATDLVGSSYLTYLLAAILLATLAGLILPYRRFFPQL